MEKFIVLIWFEFGFWAAVFIAIVADLISGVRKAIKAGVARTSYGYRRSVDKILRYYGTLLLLTVFDSMQIASIWYSNGEGKTNWILFPFITLIYSACLIMMEVKSIYEKSEDKARFASIANMANKIIANPTNLEAVTGAVMGYMNNPDTPSVAIEIEVKQVNNKENDTSVSNS